MSWVIVQSHPDCLARRQAAPPFYRITRVVVCDVFFLYSAWGRKIPGDSSPSMPIEFKKGQHHVAKSGSPCTLHFPPIPLLCSFSSRNAWFPHLFIHQVTVLLSVTNLCPLDLHYITLFHLTFLLSPHASCIPVPLCFSCYVAPASIKPHWYPLFSRKCILTYCGAKSMCLCHMRCNTAGHFTCNTLTLPKSSDTQYYSTAAST